MKCPYCSSQETTSFYKALLPNILSACNEEQLKFVRVYPFEAQFCRNCSLGFNATVLPDVELRTIYDNYLYISPVSGIGCSKYESIIKIIKRYTDAKDSIVEIGCSEGYLLNQIKQAGYISLLGIEPGPQAESAKEILGLNVVRGYFDENTKFEKPVDVFVLMHVFEHFNDPFTIIDVMKKNLSSSGKIIIEVPNFEGYHHQHLYFYNLEFLERLCKDKKMKIINYEIQKNSLSVVMAHENNQKYDAVIVPDSQKWSLEKVHKFYKEFNLNVDRINAFLRNGHGKKIYWWGAGSSSVIYINQIDKGLLDQNSLIVIDGDPNKWGKYIPGFKELQVSSYNVIQNKKVDRLIIASSFHQEIKETMVEKHIVAESVEIVI